MVRCGYMWLVEVRSGIDVVYRWYSVLRGLQSCKGGSQYVDHSAMLYTVQCTMYGVHSTMYIV